MKAAKVLSVLLAGAMSTGMVFAAESGAVQNMKERWEKRQAQREEIREKIEGELKKQDAELDKVQSDLKSAPADKKLDALTAAVNVLIDQRREMHHTMETLGNKLKSARENGQLFKGNQPQNGSAFPEASPGGGNGGAGSAIPSPAPTR